MQDTTFGKGIDRMSADGFSREMEMHYQEAFLDDQPHVAQKNTIEGRLDVATLAKLRALRDS